MKKMLMTLSVVLVMSLNADDKLCEDVIANFLSSMEKARFYNKVDSEKVYYYAEETIHDIEKVQKACGEQLLKNINIDTQKLKSILKEIKKGKK